MRPLFLIAVLVTVACAPQAVAPSQPTDRFYYPTALALAPDAGSGGVLYVASTNWDNRYLSGLLTAVDLDRIRGANDAGLPGFGAPFAGAPISYEQLNTAPTGTIGIDNLGGQAGTFPYKNGLRIFIPSRTLHDSLNVIDVEGTQMSCGVPLASDPRNCGANPALWLSKNRHNKSKTNLPAAPSVYGVAVAPAVDGGPDGDVYVTHLANGDSPAGSALDSVAYLVHLSALNPVLTDKSYVILPYGGGDSVALARRYAFISGRLSNTTLTTPDDLLRVIDRQFDTAVADAASPCLPDWPCLQSQYHAVEGRGLVLGPEYFDAVTLTTKQNLYLLTRGPDALLVISVTLSGSFPSIAMTRAVPLPAGPTSLAILPRTSGVDALKGNLIAITCTEANSMVFYDDNTGGVVGQIRGVGNLPYQMVAQPVGAGARFFVSSFGDGRVAVVDVPDLFKVSGGFVRGFIGKNQTCIVRNEDPICARVTP